MLGTCNIAAAVAVDRELVYIEKLRKLETVPNPGFRTGFSFEVFASDDYFYY